MSQSRHAGVCSCSEKVRASCTRLVTPSLRKTLRRWYSTVLALMKSRPAISRLDRRSAASRAICASCAVSTSGAAGLGPLAGGAQLGSGPARESRHAHLVEQHEGMAELVAGVAAAALAAQPLPVHLV